MQSHHRTYGLCFRKLVVLLGTVEHNQLIRPSELWLDCVAYQRAIVVRRVLDRKCHRLRGHH